MRVRVRVPLQFHKVVHEDPNPNPNRNPNRNPNPNPDPNPDPKPKPKPNPIQEEEEDPGGVASNTRVPPLIRTRTLTLPSTPSLTRIPVLRPATPLPQP